MDLSVCRSRWRFPSGNGRQVDNPVDGKLTMRLTFQGKKIQGFLKFCQPCQPVNIRKKKYIRKKKNALFSKSFALVDMGTVDRVKNFTDA